MSYLGFNSVSRRFRKNDISIQLKALFLLVIFIFSLSSTNYSIPKSTAQISTIFSLIILTDAENRRRNAIANYLNQELAGLGIDVKVISKPYVQQLADLVNDTQNNWDISIATIVPDSRLAPKFTDEYSCKNGFHAIKLYRYCNSAWDESLEKYSSQTSNIFPFMSKNLNQDGIDQLLERIQYTFNETERRQLLNSFQKIFMEDLLYSYPLLGPPKTEGIWKGFENFNPNLGLVRSSFRGGYWNYEDYSTLNQRKHGANSISLPIGFFNQKFDPLQVENLEENKATAYSFPTLGFFDDNTNAHPNVAKSYKIQTWENAPLLQETSECEERLKNCAIIAYNKTIPSGHIQFTLRDDAFWISTSGGVKRLEERVKPSDFKFTFDIKSSEYFFTGGFNSILNSIWEIEADDENRILDFYFIKPSIEDMDIISQAAVPAHLLNTTLTLLNGSKFHPLLDFGDSYLNPAELSQEGLNGFDSAEWDKFERNPLQAGPYYSDFSNQSMVNRGNFLIKRANPYFWFPNEKGSPNQNFDRNNRTVATPYFFNYAGTEEPDRLLITELIYQVTSSKASQLSFFKDGQIDQNDHFTVNENEIVNQKLDERFSVYDVILPIGADLVLFNFENENLIKYPVRKAIALSINKSILAQITDRNRDSQDSPVPRYFSDYYNDTWKIDYNKDEARLLLANEGYYSTNSSTNFPPTFDYPVISAIIIATVIGGGLFIATLTILSKRLLRNRKIKEEK